MSDIDNWLKDKTGTDFFTLTTPKDEVTPESMFWRAITNELGVVVIPKDRNLQLRDLLPVVIVDTNRSIRRSRLSEGSGHSMPLEPEAMPLLKGFELEPKSNDPSRFKPEKNRSKNDLPPLLMPLELDRIPNDRSLDSIFRLRPKK